MDALILRFDAPLMSFGGVRVDQHNVSERFPGLSLFAGLLSNALGWHHRDGDRIGRLQERLVVASRWDILGEAIVDYHTVDLGQPKMREAGWTTRGKPEHRARTRMRRSYRQNARIDREPRHDTTNATVEGRVYHNETGGLGRQKW